MVRLQIFSILVNTTEIMVSKMLYSKAIKKAKTAVIEFYYFVKKIVIPKTPRDLYRTCTVRSHKCFPGFLCVVQELADLRQLAHEGRLVTLRDHVDVPQHQLLKRVVFQINKTIYKACSSGGAKSKRMVMEGGWGACNRKDCPGLSWKKK